MTNNRTKENQGFGAKQLLTYLAGIPMLIPGLATMMGAVLIPPGYQLLFGGVLTAVGALAMGLILANVKRIKEMQQKKLNKIIITLCIVFVVLLAVYIYCSSMCIVNHEDRGSVYFPLWTSEKLAEMIKLAGSRYALIEGYGRDGAVGLINETSFHQLLATTVIHLLIYQLMFIALIIAYGLIIFRLGRVEPAGAN